MTIRILEYDQADPLGVLNLNLLSLNYALSPERVALIRQHDPRPFPFFGLYAVEDDFIAGQVGVYRLPMMTIAGPEDVGGICAVCTNPAFNRRGVASHLLDEAHQRMRADGLRFSTLGTARHRGAYSLYRRLGYEDVHTTLTTFATYTSLVTDHQMRVEGSGVERLHLVDEIFGEIAAGHLGFAHRHQDFMKSIVVVGDVNVENVWLFWEKDELAGYAVARFINRVLIVDHLMLKTPSNAGAALAALAKNRPVTAIQVRIDHPSIHSGLRQAGFPRGQPSWSTFMIKPLFPSLSVEDGIRLFGVGTDQFLISILDVT